MLVGEVRGLWGGAGVTGDGKGSGIEEEEGGEGIREGGWRMVVVTENAS